MESIKTLLIDNLKYLTTIGIADVFDILVVTAFVYWLLALVQRTRLVRIAKGIGILIVVLWLSAILKMSVVNFLLGKAVELGLIVLVILFQPELRRLLERVGSGKFLNVFSQDYTNDRQASAITQVSVACGELSKSKTGALIIFERENQLSAEMVTGTVIDSIVTARLLQNIFYDKSPLHDGAVIIREGRIAAAGCLLPNSNDLNISKDLGMRHRAGIGISEQTDAVVLIVSEETGAISMAIDGMLRRHLTAEGAEPLLRKELLSEKTNESRKEKLLSSIRGNRNEQK